jgi:hypothetical protein
MGISPVGCRPPRLTRSDFDRSAPRTHRVFMMLEADARAAPLTLVRR